MTDLSITILPETGDDAVAIERLHERTFGPGRYARTAFRIREGISHDLSLSFTARIGTLLVGSVRLSPVRIGEARALLLGPLTIEPPFRDRGIGLAMMQRALSVAKEQGHSLVILVGDEPYYARVGFMKIPDGQMLLPGPVDPKRFLFLELRAGSLSAAHGLVLPENRFREQQRFANVG